MDLYRQQRNDSKSCHSAQPGEKTDSSSIVCTLSAGDYHFGLGALVNSLYAKGFRGDIYVGFRGELPFWAAKSARPHENGWSFVLNGCYLHFIPLSTTDFLNNHKPDFILQLMEVYCPTAQRFFYLDADAIIKAPWSFFEHWTSCGIALCEDMNDYLPAHHPIRQAWTRYAHGHGLEVARTADRFYNSGFFAFNREQAGFLKVWKRLFDCRVSEGADLTSFLFSKPGYPYLCNDQDLMNLALMIVSEPISAVGAEGMGFKPGAKVMSHSAGEIKSWRKHFIWESLRGRPPSGADKDFVQHASAPIKIYSKARLTLKWLAVKVGSLIGRFYARHHG
jgi:hypothetical protein